MSVVVSRKKTSGATKCTDPAFRERLNDLRKERLAADKDSDEDSDDTDHVCRKDPPPVPCPECGKEMGKWNAKLHLAKNRCKIKKSEVLVK